MEPRIKSLEIEGYRALRKLSIDGLGRVNLVTGRNNTGKSSLLEALRILASDGSPSVLFGIVRYREEDTGGFDEGFRWSDIDDLLSLASLFSGIPDLRKACQGISIRAQGPRESSLLELKNEWLRFEGTPKGPQTLVPSGDNCWTQEGDVPALLVESSGESRSYDSRRLRGFREEVFKNPAWRPELRGEAPLRWFYVSPYIAERTATLGALWDEIALSDREQSVVEALRILEPKITAVSMVGGETPRQPRVVIVRSRDFERPVPLRSFGDGLNRLFAIVLALVNAESGFLLIDEFENGMHHTVQLDAWRAIFRLAKSLDVQVVATSHSWDAIEAFQKAAAETPEDGVLVRLTRRGADIVSTVFREDELAIATRDGIEVR